MYRTRIAGTGSYLPEKVLTNADLEKMVDTNDQWIRERTGMQRRHIAGDGQACSDLGLVAAERALKKANLKATDLDYIIYATVTGDQHMPSTACILQQKLGCPGIPAFDLAAACSGFVYALSIADAYIRMGQYKNILVVGAEVLSTYVNYKDRETCILFGDAGGAFVLQRANADDKNVIVDTFLRSEGQFYDLLSVVGGGSKIRPSVESVERGDFFITMKGREIFKNAVRVMSSCCKTILDRNNIPSNQIDWLIPHQANTRIMEAVAGHFEFPVEKVINVVAEMGNTSSATIPIAFDMAVEDGRIQRGQQILFTAFGAGLTAGSLVVRY